MKTPTRQILANRNVQTVPASACAAGPALKQPPTPEVQQLINTQSLFISELKDALAGLRDRLSTVLIDTPPSDSHTGAAQSGPSSELGKALDVNNEDISSLTAHIKSLTNQLAV